MDGEVAASIIVLAIDGFIRMERQSAFFEPPFE
jgi:hypothetical protein